MNANTLEAISYIIEVAVVELPILTWISMLNYIYPNGIPEDAKFGTAINYFVERFPDFESRSQEITAENFCKLYEEVMTYISETINNKK